MRLQLRSLASARLVCKKWRDLTTTNTFMQLRREGLFHTPWLFLFGVLELHILDVSQSQWHTKDYEILKGWCSFSVASPHDVIYVVGGCSAPTKSRSVASSYKAHKGVLVFNPLTKSAREVASINHARSTPVLGSEDCKRFIIIAVGGYGSMDEVLDSGEIYDPISNTWTEINRLPAGFCVACSGVVCKGTFYVYSMTDKLIGYNLEMGYWAGIDHSSPPRVIGLGSKLISCKNRLFMFYRSRSTDSRNIDVEKFLEFDDMDLSWRVVSVHPYDLEIYWVGSNAADEDCIFGIRMFIILGQCLNFVTLFDLSGGRTSRIHVPTNYMPSGGRNSMSVLRF